MNETIKPEGEKSPLEKDLAIINPLVKSLDDALEAVPKEKDAEIIDDRLRESIAELREIGDRLRRLRSSWQSE